MDAGNIKIGQTFYASKRTNSHVDAPLAWAEMMVEHVTAARFIASFAGANAAWRAVKFEKKTMAELDSPSNNPWRACQSDEEGRATFEAYQQEQRAIAQRQEARRAEQERVKQEFLAAAEDAWRNLSEEDNAKLQRIFKYASETGVLSFDVAEGTTTA